jgi:hypothetical protein
MQRARHPQPRQHCSKSVARLRARMTRSPRRQLLSSCLASLLARLSTPTSGSSDWAISARSTRAESTAPAKSLARQNRSPSPESRYSHGADIPGFRGLIDKDTPASAMTRLGTDGAEYQVRTRFGSKARALSGSLQLVFSGQSPRLAGGYRLSSRRRRIQRGEPDLCVLQLRRVRLPTPFVSVWPGMLSSQYYACTH